MVDSFNDNNNYGRKDPKRKDPKKKLVLISVIVGVSLIAISVFIVVLYQYFGSVDQQISQGQKYLLDKKYDQAISAFLKAIKAEYNNIPARLGLGEAYMALGQYSNAENSVLKALDIDPQNKDAYIVLQDLYALSDDYSKMAETLETMRHMGLEHSIVYGIVSGKLIDGIAESLEDATALSDAHVTIKLGDQDIKTFPADQGGMYLTYLRQNIVYLTLEKENYLPYTQQIEIRPNEVLCMPTISMASVSNTQNAKSEPAKGSQLAKYLAATTVFTVTYDFEENGGASATRASGSLIVGKTIDLTPEAVREDWDFVGWNTNKNAEAGLISLPMVPDNVTLYAIYKKTLTVTFNDYNGTAPATREESHAIYNKATDWQMTLPEQNSYTDWTSSGWVPSPSLLSPGQDPNTSVSITQDTTFYGVYRNQFTLTYANGGSSSPPRETKVVYVNSSDPKVASKPFTLAQPGTRNGSTFAGWALDSQNGYVYQAGDRFGVPRHATLYGVWK
ncbi:MAG: InlB B-repeat-containing protein [Peptococcaceae bacterium]|nr:InlB B-repeat-containing protein [Peptococcaceae bacterium]